MPQPTRTAVVLFARAPELESKRFGLRLSTTRRLHAALLAQSLEVATRSGARLVVALEGQSDAIPAEAILLRQSGDGFEQRLLGALRQVRDAGFERIVVIGSDTPALTSAHLRRACSSRSWMIGPSLDGGAYLIGLPASELEVLRGLPWCTGRLRAALEERLEARARSALELEALRDIDDSADVRASWADLVALCERHSGAGLDREPAHSVLRELRQDHLWLQLTAPLSPQAPPSAR